MRRFVCFAATTFCALAVTACAPLTVGSHVQRGLDFATYRTYDWGPPDRFPAGDPRLDRNPFFKDHFEGAVERQMAARGFERAASGVPDVLIHYHASVTQRLDVNRVDREFGYCYDESCQAKVIEYEAGTLVLDIVDSRTNRLIWRGWAQANVKALLDNEDEVARRVNEAVKRMLERLPTAALATWRER